MQQKLWKRGRRARQCQIKVVRTSITIYQLNIIVPTFITGESKQHEIIVFVLKDMILDVS